MSHENDGQEPRNADETDAECSIEGLTDLAVLAGTTLAVAPEGSKVTLSILDPDTEEPVLVIVPQHEDSEPEPSVSFDDGVVKIGLTVTDSDLLFLQANRAVEEEDYARALDLYSQAIELTPTDPEIVYNRGIVHGRLGQFEASVNDYSKAISLNPDDHKLWGNRGGIRAQMNDLEGALSDWSEARSRVSGAFAAQYSVWMGQTLYNDGQHTAASAMFAQGIEHDPGYADIHSEKGKADLQREDWEAAVVAFTEDIARDGTSEISHWNRHMAYRNMGDLASARSDLGFAISIAPQAHFYTESAQLAFDLGSPEAALDDLNAAIALAANDADLHHKCALMCHNAGQHEHAIGFWGTCARLDPQHPTATTGIALNHLILEQYEQAIPAFTAAIQLQPDEASHYSNRGWVHYCRGDAEAALADYARAIGVDPGYAKVYYNRACLHEALGRFDDARSDYLTLQDVCGHDVLEELKALDRLEAG